MYDRMIERFDTDVTSSKTNKLLKIALVQIVQHAIHNSSGGCFMAKGFEIFSNERIQGSLSEAIFYFGSQTKHSFEMILKDTTRCYT